jgi:hypothetical protein
MGKASSSKKVARASRAAGKPGSSRNLLWPAAMVALVALGVVLIFVSRPDRAEAERPRANNPEDHWHTAYGVYICNEYAENFTDQNGDALGIHTHEDGLIHIHPTASEAAGENATLGVFTDEVNLTLEDDRLDLPGEDGKTYRNGDECGDERGIVQLVVWEDAADEEAEVITDDPAGHRLRDGEVVAIAFAPEGAEIPKPPSTGTQPADLPGASVPPTAPPATGSTTTTAAGGSTTTTAGGTTTTTAP